MFLESSFRNTWFLDGHKDGPVTRKYLSDVFVFSFPSWDLYGSCRFQSLTLSKISILWHTYNPFSFNLPTFVQESQQLKLPSALFLVARTFCRNQVTCTVLKKLRSLTSRPYIASFAGLLSQIEASSILPHCLLVTKISKRWKVGSF